VDKNETIMIFADMNSSSCCFVPDDVPNLKVLKEQQIVKEQEYVEKINQLEKVSKRKNLI
jgi:hypothetical protein